VEPEVEPDVAAAPIGPVIHMPDRTLDDQDGDGDSHSDGAAPVKKKTRRGSRGGKNRRKKPVGAAVATVEPETVPETEVPETEVPETEVPETEVPETEVSDTEVSDTPPEPVADEPSPAENGDEDWGYTPMSQWGLDE
jgi:hypothetical protein